MPRCPQHQAHPSLYPHPAITIAPCLLVTWDGQEGLWPLQLSAGWALVTCQQPYTHTHTLGLVREPQDGRFRAVGARWMNMRPGPLQVHDPELAPSLVQFQETPLQPEFPEASVREGRSHAPHAAFRVDGFRSRASME